MEVYQVEHDDIMRLKESDFGKEEQLEERLVRTATVRIGGVELLYISRQGTTKKRKRFDLTALDENGDLVVVELKKGQAPRRVIAQALDYVSDLQNHEYSELEADYEEFLNTEHQHTDEESQSLRKAHSNYFDHDEPLPEEQFNDDQRIIIIGESFDDATLNMADYLRERGGIDVILVRYRVYQDEDQDEELLITNSILPPDEEHTPSPEQSLSDKDERQKDFWRQFQQKHRRFNLQGSGVSSSASYAIHVFPSGDRRKPAYIRPTVYKNGNVFNLVRFYEEAREFPKDEDQHELFETAVEEAVSDLDIELPDDLLNEYELEWDVDEEREDFDKVRINYGDVDHDEFRDEGTIEDIQRWLIDTSRVFKTALEELADEGYIENTA